VSNTLVSDNGGVGIQFVVPSGTGTMTGVIDHVQVQNNGNMGLNFFSNTTVTFNMTVSDSVFANNATSGIRATSGNNNPSSVMVRNSTIANNGSYGLDAGTGGGSIIRVTRSTITGNPYGWEGTVLSYGDNNIDGNTNTNTEPPNPLQYH
jgi:hypothetical protein